MNWYLAASLKALFAEANVRWPDRSKKSDGSIGDPSHSSRLSDHNPDRGSNPPGVVRAIDITHDPRHGADMARLSEQLRRRCKSGQEPRVRYVIFDGRVFHTGAIREMYGVAMPQPFRWYPYKGPSSHRGHMHVSIRRSLTAERSKTKWLPPEDSVGLTDADVDKIVDALEFRQRKLLDLIRASRDAVISAVKAQPAVPPAAVDLPAVADAVADEIAERGRE